MDMTRLEAILERAKGLSAVERAQLLHELTANVAEAHPDDEIAVGQRGLAAWTESTRSEDWSKYYPDSLRTGERNSP